jgi:hypothetical protein
MIRLFYLYFPVLTLLLAPSEALVAVLAPVKAYASEASREFSTFTDLTTGCATWFGSSRRSLRGAVGPHKPIFSCPNVLHPRFTFPKKQYSDPLLCNPTVFRCIWGLHMLLRRMRDFMESGAAIEVLAV